MEKSFNGSFLLLHIEREFCKVKNIELKNCTKTYMKNNKKIIVLNKINYTFYYSKFYAIMGNSGSGKSTLINILAGLIKTDFGEILYDGKLQSTNFQLAKLRNENIGLVYQSYLLNDNMTALENVILPLLLNPTTNISEAKEKAKKLLKKFGLEKRYSHYPKELSGGEQQRVAIARALINNPDIILADEPTGNLDKENEKYVFSLLKELSKSEKKCVIVVSHNENINKYADEILILKDGKLNEKK